MQTWVTAVMSQNWLGSCHPHGNPVWGCQLPDPGLFPGQAHPLEKKKEQKTKQNNKNTQRKTTEWRSDRNFSLHVCLFFSLPRPVPLFHVSFLLPSLLPLCLPLIPFLHTLFFLFLLLSLPQKIIVGKAEYLSHLRKNSHVYGKQYRIYKKQLTRI